MYDSDKRASSAVSNADIIMRIFRLGAELQFSLYNNVSTFEIRKLFVQRFVLDI